VSPLLRGIRVVDFRSVQQRAEAGARLEAPRGPGPGSASGTARPRRGARTRGRGPGPPDVQL